MTVSLEVKQENYIYNVIRKNEYKGIRDQDGWQTLELTVRADFPKLANRILKALDNTVTPEKEERFDDYAKARTVEIIQDFENFEKEKGIKIDPKTKDVTTILEFLCQEKSELITETWFEQLFRISDLAMHYFEDTLDEYE